MAGFKEILKHGRNYLAANLATKALAFISIPIYTRLLSTEEYGVVSIFLGVAGILGSVMALSMDRSISRYYFDQKSLDDFKQFNGTSLILSIIAFLLNSLLLLIFAENFGNKVGLEKNVVYLLIPFTLINIIGLMFEQINGAQKQSKIIAITSLYRVYVGFALSILFILLFSSYKDFGLIYGQIIAGILISIYWIKKITPFFKLKFNRSYIKYIFTYSVPLIPYALSGVIIEQFGKIAIGNSVSISNAGFYTLAASIGGLVSIVIGVTHQAWNPYYMEYMNSKNYKQLDSDFIKIFKLTIATALFITCFGHEIGLLLAKKEFTESLYLIPIFTIGYIFYQLSYTFLRNFGYSKSTQYMTVTVLISGISNVLLNLILIPRFGELGAALSFVAAYIIMTILAWAINTFLVKLHATSIKLLYLPMLIAIPFYVLIYIISFMDLTFYSIFLKLLLLITFLAVIFYKDRKTIFDLVHKLFNKKKHNK